MRFTIYDLRFKNGKKKGTLEAAGRIDLRFTIYDLRFKNEKREGT